MKARGFTIIEVLVSLVVLSIGLLGIGKLVLVSAHANDSAYLRGQATELAYEILDNMRANRQTAMTQGYDVALGTVPLNPGSCLAATCAAPQLALYDVYTWKRRLDAAVPGGQLPGGKGSVATSATTPTTATITVQWDDTAAQTTFAGTAVGNAANNMSVVLETVL
jgi:type IV pilus assembly protein PilV